MIRIRLISKDADEFSAFESAGHAGSAEYGKDIVCAAVTALLKTAVLTLKAAESKGLLRVKIDAERAGFLSAKIEESDKKNGERLRCLFEFLTIGLLSIEAEYPDCLNLEIVNE